MSSYIQPQMKTFCADADLAQHTFVKLGSKDENVDKAGVGEKAFGVNMSQNVKSGDACEVAHLGGGALIKLAAAVTRGDSIAPNADGEGIVAGAGVWAGGIAMQSGAIGDVISILLDGHKA